VRDHRATCVVGDVNCRDHREPVVVVPPRVQPEPPVVIIDPTPTGAQPDWRDQGDNFGISCKMGRNILKRNGFRHVQAFDCEGRYYGYYATKRHHTVKVKMNLDGDIVAIKRVRF
jgi:hypothetical protein